MRPVIGQKVYKNKKTIKTLMKQFILYTEKNFRLWELEVRL